jgi:hypothetical protein
MRTIVRLLGAGVEIDEGCGLPVYQGLLSVY